MSRALFLAVGLALIASLAAIPTLDFVAKQEVGGTNIEKDLHDKFVSWKAEVRELFRTFCHVLLGSYLSFSPVFCFES